MDHTTLWWTVMVDDQAGRATLIRSMAERHWESAELQQKLGSDVVSVWVDSDDVPVVVEARLIEVPSGDTGSAGMLEGMLSSVLGSVSLGSPTLWGMAPGWVWYGVSTVWPPLTAEERAEELRGSLESAASRAKRNAARRNTAR